jgi:autotransporter-associated beta strand protein
VLRKPGPATLTLSGANTYSSGTAIENGTLEVGSLADGTGSIGSGLLAMDHVSALRYSGTGSETTIRYLWLNGGPGVRTFEITNASASLTFSGGGQISRPIRKTGDGALVLGVAISDSQPLMIDVRWNGGKIVSAKLAPERDGALTIRHAGRTLKKPARAGVPLELTAADFRWEQVFPGTSAPTGGMACGEMNF